MTLVVNNQTVVAFDLDDTLYNEIEFLKSAFEEIAYLLDDSNHLELYAKMFGLYRLGGDVFQFLTDQYGIEKSLLLNRYRNHRPKLTPFNSAERLLESIKQYGGKIAIITDGRKTTQWNKIKGLGLEYLVDKVIISDELGSEKPSLDNFKVIERYFKKLNYYYIGDNNNKDFIISCNTKVYQKQ